MKRFPTQRGAALITSLWVAVILLILAMAYLSILQVDFQFSARQEQKVKAFYLARAGMEYFAAQRVLPSPDPATGEKRFYFPPNQATHYCIIEQDSRSGGYVYTGVITRHDGQMLARRSLVCPKGDVYTWYERKEWVNQHQQEQKE